MGLKNVRILYQARNNTTGLTNVKGQVYLNQVAKAVAGSALVFTELSATNAPGVYYLDIAPATLVTWGVVAGSINSLEVVINSATQNAEAVFKQDVTVYNTDDLQDQAATLSADVAAVKADTAAIKLDVEDASTGLAAIKAAVDAIQNQAGFAVPVPAQLVIPPSGSNVYRIPVTLYNNSNALIDADTNTITVGLVNQAGTSRNSYLSSTTMTRDSLGQYHVDVTIASSAVEEELIFTFSYAIGGAATARKAVTETIPEAASSGLALQSTLLSVQTAVDAIKLDVEDVTNGLAAINANVSSVGTAVGGLNTILTNGTYGNAALQSMLADMEGAGFATGADSLKAISTFLSDNLYAGGRAV